MTRSSLDLPQQSGRLAVITGTGGLGYEAALVLARAGARVVIAGRNAEKGREAVSTIMAAAPQAEVSFEELDLASLASIERFAVRMIDRGDGIDLLINNAGIMSPPQRRTTEDGVEMQFGVNHLGHFALTLRLLPLLRQVPTPRVVSVTSLAQHYAKLDFDDLQSAQNYKPGRAYCASKLVQAMFAIELQRRSDAKGWGLLSLAAHPGFATTNLFENGKGGASLGSLISTRIVGPLLGQSPADGAKPTLYAATSPDIRGGRLYGPKGFMEMKGAPGECDFAKAAKDERDAARLWQISEDLAGLRLDA